MTKEELEKRLEEAEAVIAAVIEAHRFYTPQHQYLSRMLSILESSSGVKCREACQLIHDYYVKWFPDKVLP